MNDGDVVCARRVIHRVQTYLLQEANDKIIIWWKWRVATSWPEDNSKKMANDQLIEFAMKLQNNVIGKQTELINDNKEFREKLSIIDSKFDEVRKEN